MLDLVIGTKRNAAAIDNLIMELEDINLSGTFYVGYPTISTPDETVFIEALLTCKEYGVVVFEFEDDATDTNSREFWENLETKQNDLYVVTENKLKQHKALLNKRQLAVPLNVVSYTSRAALPPEDVNVLIATQYNLRDVLEGFEAMSSELVVPLNAAIQRVTTIKPPKKRVSVEQERSKGGILKHIEREIANLDKWQKRAAIETPEGAQRIRGLAGSGKTVVLALKAAYLHAQHPEWNIAVTFQTRSLYQQFQDLVRRFSFEHLSDEPDWRKLHILHAWGSTSSPGVYSEIAEANGITPRDFSYAKLNYGQNQAFSGVCQELLDSIKGQEAKPIYDAILIDEAQDFPEPFFQLVFEAVSEPKRIVWAYDELQNLSDFSMAPPAELFGLKADGTPKIALHNEEGQAQQDIILPVCYRNTPWALATAHAAGFGIYRKEGLTQFFDDGDLWTQIGYEVKAGELTDGKNVTLARSKTSSPEYFDLYLEPHSAVECMVFENQKEQADWVAECVHKNITEDELEISDILLISLNPVQVPKDASHVIRALAEKGLEAHIAGVTSSRDLLFTENSIAITSIYRAKGNEAPMVYVMNSHYGFDGYELIKRRNALFTAITRSRAWVRICGVGAEMQMLKDEIEEVARREYRLEFRVPTEEERRRMRQIHRDMTPEEKEKVKQVERGLKNTVELVESGLVSLENIPGELRERLKNLFDKG